MPSALIGEILKEGFRVILISVLIELALLILAFGIGIGVWIAEGLLSGIVSGIMAFVVGQALAIMIIDSTLFLDASPSSRESSREESSDAVLAELRKELESADKQ